MTGANVLQLGKENKASAPELSAGKEKIKKTAKDAVSMFSNVMNQQNITASSKSKTEQTTVDASSQASAYDKYRYKDREITKTTNDDVKEKVFSKASDKVEEISDQIKTVVAKRLNCSEEELEEKLAELGISAIDLLNPNNLAMLVKEQDKGIDNISLLFQEDMSGIMEDMRQLGKDLMEAMAFPKEKLEEVVAYVHEHFMKVEPQSLGQDEQAGMVNLDEVQNGQGQESLNQSLAVAGGEVVTMEEGELPLAEMDKSIEVVDLRPKDEKAAEEQEVLPMEKVSTETEEKNSAVDNALEEDSSLENVNDSLRNQDTKGDAKGGEKRESESQNGKMTAEAFTVKGHDFSLNQETISFQNMDVDMDMPLSQMPVSYADVDAMQIIEQLTQQAKVIFETDATTMEMQLNPANLGKIYLNVSTKEGVVNAQITASNEAVKEALEVQIADLKNNLNQAGVKVDAIEVTVASHEFEQNLEQGQRDEQREEQRAKGRRNLRMDSLDDLVGLMSEEEALVAQMMRDNGNSVNLSA